MGRELRRVPMDFSWPIGEVWGGYINPFYHQGTQCTSCGRTGLSPELKKIKDEWYSFYESEWIYISSNRRYNNLAHQYHITQAEVDALVEEGRLQDFTHTFIAGQGWVEKDPPFLPTPEMVNEWSKDGMGHDSINQWICMKARAKELGFDPEGVCPVCKGDGLLWPSEEIKQAYENWEPTAPPKGDGFQLWGTTSEGNPASPVFETLEALCEWCADNATTFASFKASKDEWMKMLDDGFVSHQEGNMIFI